MVVEQELAPIQEDEPINIDEEVKSEAAPIIEE
jgi:hypothetical protein